MYMQQHVGKGTDRPASEEALTVSLLIASLAARPASHVTLVKSSDDEDDEDDDDDDDDSGNNNDDDGDGDRNDDDAEMFSNAHVHNRLEEYFSGDR